MPASTAAKKQASDRESLLIEAMDAASCTHATQGAICGLRIHLIHIRIHTDERLEELVLGVIGGAEVLRLG